VQRYGKGEIMKNSIKSLLVAGIVGAIGFGGLGTVNSVHAAPMPVTDMTSSDVVSAVTSTAQTLVSNGTITSLQNTLVNAEQAKLDQDRQSDMKEVESSTDEKRKAKMAERRAKS
jgi:hypothetical protein